MKIGVTGASGFIGRKLCKALIESDFEVYKFVRREPKNDSEIYWKPSKKEIDQEKFESLDAVNMNPMTDDFPIGNPLPAS